MIYLQFGRGGICYLVKCCVCLGVHGCVSEHVTERVCDGC